MSDFELKDRLLKLKKPISKKLNNKNETSDDYTELPQQYPIPIKLIDPNTKDYLDHYSAYLQPDGKIFVKNELEAKQLYKHGYFGKGEFSRGNPNCFRNDKYSNNKSNETDNIIARLKQIPEMTQEKYDRRYEWHNKSKQQEQEQQHQNLDEQNNKSNNFNNCFINEFLKEYKIIDLSRNNNQSNNGNISKSKSDDYYYVKIYRNNKSSEEEQLFDSNSKTNPFNYIIKKMPLNYIFKENFYLMREEAYFLCYALGCLKVYDYITNFEINLLDLWRKFCSYDSQFVYKYIVYHKLRVDGWVVRNGLMYASDFLIYYKGPDYYHSSYSIVVKSNEDHDKHDLNNLFSIFAGLIRINENASKDVLVCYVLFDSDNVNLSTPNCIKRSYLKSVIANRWLPKQNRDNITISNDDKNNNNNLNKNADDDD